MANELDVSLPVLEIDAWMHQDVLAPHFLLVAMNLKGGGLSQYRGYNFESMCIWNGVALGANKYGIFELDSGDLDGDCQINAFFETPTTDFGVVNQKRFRALYLGYETDGSLLIKVQDDQGNEREYVLEALKDTQISHGGKLPIGRDGKGRYWMIRVENYRGSDFSIDNIHTHLVALYRKPAA